MFSVLRARYIELRFSGVLKHTTRLKTKRPKDQKNTTHITEMQTIKNKPKSEGVCAAYVHEALRTNCIVRLADSNSAGICARWLGKASKQFNLNASSMLHNTLVQRYYAHYIALLEMYIQTYMSWGFRCKNLHPIADHIPSFDNMCIAWIHKYMSRRVWKITRIWTLSFYQLQPNFPRPP